MERAIKKGRDIEQGERWVDRLAVARDAPRHNGAKLIAEIWVQCKRDVRLGVDWGFMKKATTSSHKSAISSGTLSRRPRGRMPPVSLQLSQRVLTWDDGDP